MGKSLLYEVGGGMLLKYRSTKEKGGVRHEKPKKTTKRKKKKTKKKKRKKKKKQQHRSKPKASFFLAAQDKTVGGQRLRVDAILHRPASGNLPWFRGRRKSNSNLLLKSRSGGCVLIR